MPSHTRSFRVIILMLALVFCAMLPTSVLAKKQTAQESFTSNMQHFAGYMDFYYDAATDKIYLLVDSLDTEFLYLESLSTGVGSNDIGLDRGQLGEGKVVKFIRRGNKVLLLQPNYRYRALSANTNERKAVEEAFATSVLWAFEIVTEEQHGLLIDLTPFLFQDAHQVAHTLAETGQGTYALQSDRSVVHLERTRNFPQNTEFDVQLTYTGEATGTYIKSVTPTPEVVTVGQHHSFIQLPDQQYRPRKFDPRAGYFGLSFYDYAAPIGSPLQQQWICRHRLQKKEATAPVSEAVEPIVYYLDRGTPEPIRSALMEGARWWNQAFEAIGYKNAFQVELMPEGADMMDVRYNVIQWVHRATRGWSYGAAVVDPRTGEIIKGHVTLGSLRVRQDYLIAEGLLAPYQNDSIQNDAMLQMALARLRQLAAHEVGHTLGLAHSYTSSSENFASVMDYPHPYVQIADGKPDVGKAYDAGIGEWDKVAIAYGYQNFTGNGNEQDELERILQNAFADDLTFLSDQDARPAGSSHTKAHLWDNGHDAVHELRRVMEIREIALQNFNENTIPKGIPMAKIEEAFVPVYFFHRYQVEAAIKVVGGMDYTYAIKGDGQSPVTLIAAETQHKALLEIMKTIQPKALMISPELMQKIPPFPMGYDRSREVASPRTSMNFDPVVYAESAAHLVLQLLLNPARLNRLAQNHSIYPQQPSLQQVLQTLLKETVEKEWNTPYEMLVKRTVNGVLVKQLMTSASASETAPEAKAIVWYTLKNLENYLQNAGLNASDPTQKAHLAYLVSRLQHYFASPEKWQPVKPATPPPGSPIGMEVTHPGFHSCTQYW